MRFIASERVNGKADFVIDKKKSCMSHSHELKGPQRISSVPSELTPEMKEYIRKTSPSLKAKCSVAKMVNEQFGTSFEPRQSYYLLSCLKDEQFGSVEEDAQQLLEYLKRFSKSNHIFFDYKLNEEHHLTHFLFISQEMANNFARYSDLLLLDVTHQISRYNLNMALLVGIDNEAKTIILCYGLFQKQQSESMDWFLMGISSLLNKLNIPKPKTILTDDDKTLRTNLLKHFPNSQHL